MKMTRQERIALHKKQERLAVKRGHPLLAEITEGVPIVRYIDGKLIEYQKFNNVMYSKVFEDSNAQTSADTETGGEPSRFDLSGHVPYVDATQDLDMGEFRIQSSASPGTVYGLVNKEYLDSRLDSYQTFTLTAEDIANQYVEITGEIQDNQSVRLYLDNIGLKAEVGEDYSLSGNQIFWSGYDLANTLVVGDKLHVIYV